MTDEELAVIRARHANTSDAMVMYPVPDEYGQKTVRVLPSCDTDVYALGNAIAYASHDIRDLANEVERLKNVVATLET